ncbi:MAG: hypothetical protein A2096_14860 [Spirochaetes bacterium GWF1_41_5]|nr:MAG: hypothetical protein A2096_14860 [Spirochaetes bacterium GWF1_41_5]HBE01609.1 hypothetical protein [Spirochaetia bacterium]
MKPQNVLFILVDQLIRDTLFLYGGKIQKTPNLNAFFNDACVFTGAYTTVSLCSPARASIFTGTLPQTHGMLYNCTKNAYGRAEILNPEKLISRPLAEKGVPSAYFGKWHIGEKNGPAACGFSGGTEYSGYGLPSDFVPEYDFFLRENNHPGLKSVKAKNLYGDAGIIKSADLPFSLTCPGRHFYSGIIDLPTELTEPYFVARRTAEFIRNQPQNRPFFCTAAFWGPHHPALPSADFAGMHNPEEIREWINFRDECADKPRIQNRFRKSLQKELNNRTWQEWSKIVAAHFDFMAMLDASLSEIFSALRESGRENDTAVIFTSDHGDTLGCHGGQWDKGPYMYEETCAVPLLVKIPGTAGKRLACPVSNMDVYASTLELLCAQIPPDSDSRSFLPPMEGKTPARDFVTGQFYGFDTRCTFLQRMIRKEKMKYIYNPSDIDELYNLEADPGEMINLISSSEYRSELKTLKETLYRYMMETKDPYGASAFQLMDL